MSPRKKSSRSNSTLTIIILLVVLGLGAYYSITGTDVLGIFTPTEAAPPAGGGGDSPTLQPEAPNASSDWWEVYFADPINIKDPNNWGNSIEARLIEKINMRADQHPYRLLRI